MTGPTGLATLVDHYETTAGIQSTGVTWPRTELEMLQLQQRDPALSPIFAMLETDHTTPVSYGNRHYFQPLLKNGTRGALRAQWSNVDLGTLYSWMQHNHPPPGTKQPSKPSRKSSKRAQEDLQPTDRAFAEDDLMYSGQARAAVKAFRESTEELELPLNEEPPTILPSSLQPMCLRFFHDSLGHPGVRRTLTTIQTKYY